MVWSQDGYENDPASRLHLETQIYSTVCFSKEANHVPIKHLWCLDHGLAHSSACLLNITVNAELNQEAAALGDNEVLSGMPQTSASSTIPKIRVGSSS